MSIGRQIRLKRLFRNGYTFIAALDHGFSYPDTPGMENLSSSIKKALDCDIDGLILNRGGFNYLHLYTGKIPVLILHLGGGGISESYKKEKFSVSDPEEAVNLGADGVSFQINIGSKTEMQQIKEASHVVSQARKFGLFTMLMIYDKRSSEKRDIQACLRLGEELGADLIKANFDCSSEQMQKAVSNVGVPVLMAGGDSASQNTFLRRVEACVNAGVLGCSVGRNLVQAKNGIRLLKEVRVLLNK